VHAGPAMSANSVDMGGKPDIAGWLGSVEIDPLNGLAVKTRHEVDGTPRILDSLKSGSPPCKRTPK
jgi:hypothetical protein